MITFPLEQFLAALFAFLIPDPHPMPQGPYQASQPVYQYGACYAPYWHCNDNDSVGGHGPGPGVDPFSGSSFPGNSEGKGNGKGNNECQGNASC